MNTDKIIQTTKGQFWVDFSVDISWENGDPSTAAPYFHILRIEALDKDDNLVGNKEVSDACLEFLQYQEYAGITNYAKELQEDYAERMFREVELCAETRLY